VVQDPPFDLEAWLASVSSPAPIVQVGARVLRGAAAEVPERWFDTPALRTLVDVMVATMRAAPGVGLAAPQIGAPLRVFVAEDDEARLAAVSAEQRHARRRTALPLTVLLNPTLRVASSEEALFYEGCLSVRGYGAIVPRALAVHVAGVDLSGRPVALSLEGWPARIMQHEIDHLDGVIYVDRMVSRSFACDAELPHLTARPVAEVLGELGAPRGTSG
jgi:peptide deformylase